jgi:hypothetical protein
MVREIIELVLILWEVLKLTIKEPGRRTYPKSVVLLMRMVIFLKFFENLEPEVLFNLKILISGLWF